MRHKIGLTCLLSCLPRQSALQSPAYIFDNLVYNNGNFITITCTKFPTFS